MEIIGIVIPAHNEEKRIEPTLKEYLSFFRELKRKRIYDFRIIIVINGCTDNTREIVKKYECKEIIIMEFERGGKGFAVTEGFREAINQEISLIGFVDADGSTSAEAFFDLIINMHDYDGVIANRWDKRSRIITRQSLMRRFVSRGGNFVVRTLFFINQRDTQCGAKVFRREVLEKVVPQLGSSEWSFDIDLMFYMRREKARIKSIPTVWEDKKGSKLDLKKVPIKTLFSAIRLRLVHSPFKFLLRAHNRLPERMKISSLIEKIR